MSRRKAKKSMRKLVATRNGNQERKKNKSKTGLFPGLSASLGTTVGSYFGGPAGGVLGGSLGRWFGKITGLGQYKIRQNTLLTNNGPPMFSSGMTHASIVHREFLGDVKGSQDFAITKYPINPGVETTFPWAATVSNAFEQYRLKGLVFEFRTTSGTAVGSTNTALGTVVMTTDYDVLDKMFTSKKDMEAYQYTVSTVPSKSAIHPVECAPSQTTVDLKYTRDVNYEELDPDNSDLRFHDWGNFYLATTGMQADDITVGELWVSYHIELYKPRLSVNSGFCNQYVINSETTANPLGTVEPTPYSTNNIAGITFDLVNNRVHLPVGAWALVWESQRTNTSTVLAPVNAQDCEFIPAFWRTEGYWVSDPVTYNLSSCAAVYTTGPDAMVTFAATAINGTGLTGLQVFRLQSSHIPEPALKVRKTFDARRGVTLVNGHEQKETKRNDRDYEDVEEYIRLNSSGAAELVGKDEVEFTRPSLARQPSRRTGCK